MPSLPFAADATTLSAPTPAATPTAEDIASLPEMQEWAYDFEANTFLVDEDGMPYLVYRNEALKIWLFWAVITARYRWSANSRDYGTEIERFIGLPVTTAIKSSELERTIREAIQICPYVKKIESIDMSMDEGLVTVDVKIKSVYEEGWVQISVKV